jgi:hypothetical protein
MKQVMTDEEFREYIYSERFAKYTCRESFAKAMDAEGEAFRRRVADLEKAPNRRTAS